MDIKNKHKLALASLFLLMNNTFVFADPPAPSDTTKMFDTINSSGPGDFNNTLDSDKMIGDDTLPEKNISRGDTYVFGEGEAKYTKELNKTTGQWYYKDQNGNIVETFHKTIPTVQDEDNNSVSYTELYKKYYYEKNETKKAELGKKLTTKTLDIQKNGDDNIATYKKMFLQNTNIVGASQGVINNAKTVKKLDNNTISKMTKGEYDNYKRELNASKFYKDTASGYQSYHYSKEAISNTNYGTLSEMPDIVDNINEYMKSKSAIAPDIKCQISRDLVPAYKCPLPGKDGLFFPSTFAEHSLDISDSSNNSGDLRLVNLKDAQERCDKYCHTDVGDLSCFHQDVLSDANITFPDSSFSVFPFPDSFPVVKETTLDTRMPVKEISFDINVSSSESNITLSDINSFLNKYPIKMKVSVDEVSPDTNKTFNVFNLTNIIINSARMEISVPISAIGNDIKVYFYKPYFYNSERLKSKQRELFNDITNKGFSIKISNLKGEYTSKDYWYCEAKQIVDYPTDCHGPVVDISSGPNLKYICLDPDHRIGPEDNTGAFYSQSTCEQACIQYKPCYTTYSHYYLNSSGDIENNKNILYKAKISCVDSPDNTSCTDSMCEDLFKSGKLPLNEMVVQNDDKYVYTIKNGAFTKVMRPKIDLDAELGATSLDDFKELFHKEQKDAAYMYMLKYMTYNKSYFRLGENTKMVLSYYLGKSPANAADLGSTSSLDLVVKPSAFDYSDTQDYYIYIIAKTLHHFTPIAGQWVVGSGTDRHTIKAKDSFVDLEDVNYMIKTGDGDYDWQIFRREKTVKIKVDKTEYITLPDGSVESRTYHLWSHLPSYYSPAFENYDPSTEEWSAISPSADAPIYKTMKFNFDQNYFIFHIADNIDDAIANTPGNILTNQESIDHDTNFRRKYAPYPLDDGEYSSLPLDYDIYFIYSKDKLTYDDIMKKIEGDNYSNYDKKKQCTDVEYCFYEKTKQTLLFHGKIPNDGLIDNNVKMFIKGKPSNMVIGAEIDPSLSQKGKTAYMFVFLYDDTDESFLDPDNVEINSSEEKSPFDVNNVVQ